MRDRLSELVYVLQLQGPTGTNLLCGSAPSWTRIQVCQQKKGKLFHAQKDFPGLNELEYSYNINSGIHLPAGYMIYLFTSCNHSSLTLLKKSAVFSRYMMGDFK